MNIIEQHAKDIVESALENVEGFPPSRDDIEMFVHESIGGILPSAQGTSSALYEAGYYYTEFDADGVSSLADMLTYAFEAALQQEAAKLVEVQMEQIEAQAKDWEVIVDLFDDLGVGGLVEVEHDDYVFISREGIKLHKFAKAVQDYMDASGLDIIDYGITMADEKHPAIALPTDPDDTSEWEDFVNLLETTADHIDDYVSEYGLDCPKWAQQTHFEALAVSFKTNMPEFPEQQDNWMRFISLRCFLKDMANDIENYKKQYDPPPF